MQASPVDEADSADGNDDDDEGVDNSDKFDSRPVTPAPAAAMALPQACTHKYVFDWQSSSIGCEDASSR